MVNKVERGKMDCNLRRRPVPFIALFMLSATCWLNDSIHLSVKSRDVSDRRIFVKIFGKKKSDVWKNSEKKYSIFTYFLFQKRLLTGKSNTFKIKHCFLSLSAESLKNIH